MGDRARARQIHRRPKKWWLASLCSRCHWKMEVCFKGWTLEGRWPYPAGQMLLTRRYVKCYLLKKCKFIFLYKKRIAHNLAPQITINIQSWSKKHLCHHITEWSNKLIQFIALCCFTCSTQVLKQSFQINDIHPLYSLCFILHYKTWT